MPRLLKSCASSGPSSRSLGFTMYKGKVRRSPRGGARAARGPLRQEAAKARSEESLPAAAAAAPLPALLYFCVGEPCRANLSFFPTLFLLAS